MQIIKLIIPIQVLTGLQILHTNNKMKLTDYRKTIRRNNDKELGTDM